MADNYLSFEKKNGYLIITMADPASLNALGSQPVAELSKAMDEIRNDEGIRAVIFTGSGKAFVAGANIKEMAVMSPYEFDEYVRLGQEAFDKIEQLPIPTIAAVNGFALGGGCELSLACDIRIASNYAKFGLPEAALGLIPGFAGTQRLSRALGPARAKELIFTGRQVRADEAYAIGLVQYVVDAGELLEKAEEMAQTMAKNAPLSLRYSKEAIVRGAEMNLKDGLLIERCNIGLAFRSEDAQNGIEAFINKEKTTFTGK